MKKFLLALILVLLSGCGRANANHETISIDDDTIWNQYQVNMSVFSERIIGTMTDKNMFFKMKPSISINSRTTFHNAFFQFEITQNSKPYEFIMSPIHPIEQFTLDIDELHFTITISPTTASSEKSMPWIYITGVQDKLNYFILLAPSDMNDLIQNKYSASDDFLAEDKQRIIDLVTSIFTRDPH